MVFVSLIGTLIKGNNYCGFTEDARTYEYTFFCTQRVMMLQKHFNVLDILKSMISTEFPSALLCLRTNSVICKILHYTIFLLISTLWKQALTSWVDWYVRIVAKHVMFVCENVTSIRYHK